MCSPAFQTWMHALFCVDITEHMNGIQVNLRGANRLVNGIRHKITVFEKELRIGGTAIAIKQYDTLPTAQDARVH
jgi:hypothetical protein